MLVNTHRRDSITHLERFWLGNVQDILITLLVRDEKVLDPYLPELDQCARDLKQSDPGDQCSDSSGQSACADLTGEAHARVPRQPVGAIGDVDLSDLVGNIAERVINCDPVFGTELILDREVGLI